MPIDLPLIEDFQIDGLGFRFEDSRTVPASEWELAIAKINETAMQWASEHGHRGWCADDEETQNRIDAAWAVWHRDNPGRSYDEFVQDGGEAVDRVTGDTRLGIYRLLARDEQTGSVIGAFIMQNIEILEETEELVKISLYPIMGVQIEGMSVPKVWGVIGSQLLSMDIPLIDGRSLHLTEIEFPETTNTSYGLEHGEEIREFWDRLAEVVDEQDNPTGEVPVRIRAQQDRPEGEEAKPVTLAERSNRDADS